MAELRIPDPEFIKKLYKERGDSTIIGFQTQLFHLLDEESKNGSENFLQKFRHLKSNNERVSIIYEKLEQFHLLDDKFKLDAKSDSKATDYRNKGDDCFANGKFGKAFRCYTKMLMQAFSPELITSAYVNRSAASYKLKLFQESVIDIDRALARNCPRYVKRSLSIRRAKALEQAEKHGNKIFTPYEEAPRIPTNRKNPVLQFASNCIKIKHEDNSRRRVIAARDIQIGDVVAVENPFCAMIGDARLYHCHECFELCYTLIPCENCTHTLYCSETCRQNAYQKYHKDECPILYSLKDLIGKDKHFLLAIKMAFLNRDEETDEILKFNDEIDKKNICDEELKTSITAAYMYDLVKKHTSRFKGANGKETEKAFKDLILKYLRICIVQTAGVDEYCPNNDKSDVEEHETVACAIYPIYGLFRHSCAPNIFVNHHGMKRVIRALRTIKKGQECFVSYGMHYIDHTKEERQNRMYLQYHFKCRCRACTNDWPQIGQEPLLMHSGIALYVMINEFFSLNMDLIKNIVPQYLIEIGRYEEQEPCIELTSCQKLLLRCFDMLGNKRRIL